MYYEKVFRALEKGGIRYAVAGGVALVLHRTAAQDRLVADQHVAHLLERLREHDHLDASVGILERDHGHPIPFARLELPAGGNDAADRDVCLAPRLELVPRRARDALSLSSLDEARDDPEALYGSKGGAP